MEAKHVDLIQQLESLANAVPEPLLANTKLRSQLLRAASKLIPELVTSPVETETVYTNGGAVMKEDNFPVESISSQLLTAGDLNGLQKCVFDWADSYDQKDWTRLAGNVAPEIDLDYRALGLHRWPSLPLADYIAIMSAPNFLGNPAVMCQHLIGASHYTWVGTNEIEGKHQIRAAHQVYTDATRKVVKLKGHAHGTNTHRYKKIGGQWKLAGLAPKILWSEYDFDEVWKDARQ